LQLATADDDDDDDDDDESIGRNDDHQEVTRSEGSQGVQVTK